MEVKEEVEGSDHFELQDEKIKHFDFAVLAILFDSQRYDDRLTQEEVAWFYEWWDDLKFDVYMY